MIIYAYDSNQLKSGCSSKLSDSIFWHHDSSRIPSSAILWQKNLWKKLRTSPHPIWSYPLDMVGYETSFQLRTTISLWKYPLWHVGSVLNRPEFTAVLSETSWSSLFHGQNHAWQWNLQAIILCSPANFWIPDLHRSTQIYTDAAVTAVALVPWQMPIRKRHIQNRQGTMPGATETAGGHDFPWRNAWRLKDSLKERLSKAMSLPSSLTLCSDSLKLSQTQMSFRGFTRKVFGKANFSLLRVKQMRPLYMYRF